MGWKDWHSKESWERWKESESSRGWKRKGDWKDSYGNWKGDWDTKEKKDWSEDWKSTWNDSKKENAEWNTRSSRYDPIPQPAPTKERTKEEKLAPVIIQKDQPNPGFFQHLLPTTPAQAFKASTTQKAPMTPAESLAGPLKPSPSTPAGLRSSRPNSEAMLANILDALQKRNLEAWKAWTAAKAPQTPGVRGPRLPSAAQMRDWGLPLSMWTKDVHLSISPYNFVMIKTSFCTYFQITEKCLPGNFSATVEEGIGNRNG